MFCQNCGNSIPNGSNFCSECGLKSNNNLTNNSGSHKNAIKEALIRPIKTMKNGVLELSLKIKLI